jgi:peptidylprolyl isomerase
LFVVFAFPFSERRDGRMAQASHGDVVRVHYRGKLPDGTVFEKSVDDRPLQFAIGGGESITDLERAVLGMAPGESKTVRIVAGDAFGVYHDELVFALDRDRFPVDFTPEVGLDLALHETDGESLSAIVVDVSESKVTLDANHPLAGKDLTIDIDLLEIVV